MGCGYRPPMPPSITVPDYSGGSLVNLVAELERRLIGTSPSPELHPSLAAAIPESNSYVLVLFDGLGVGQLDHPSARTLRDSLVAPIDAPFPSTTTVSLATVATALPPSQHGLLGYQSWIPEAETVVQGVNILLPMGQNPSTRLGHVIALQIQAQLRTLPQIMVQRIAQTLQLHLHNVCVFVCACVCLCLCVFVCVRVCVA